MGSLNEALADAPQPANAYLSQAEKQSWAQDGTRFSIIGFEFEAEGKFGSHWSVSVITDDDDGTERRMSFKANPARDGQFQHLMGKLAESKDGVLGPALLAWIGTAAKGFWAIVPADAAAQMTLADVSDADIPY